MKPIVAIALSGGIDSLVSACLLKEMGVSAFGIHFRTGFESIDAVPPDAIGAMLSRQLEFPVHVVDLSDEFQTKVVDYFISAYGKCITPNPCLVCNPAVKFEALFKAAERHGASLLATGHYAKVVRDDRDRCHLFKGADRSKDQSYFLSFLTQNQLSRACFPLGDMTKSDVKKVASEKGLAPVTMNESQDVCFIHEKNYADFLQNHAGFASRPGPVKTLEGQTVGQHKGLHRFTVGQRRGINCPSRDPYYVVRLDPCNNTLIVGRKKDLKSTTCIVSAPHWIVTKPKLPFAAEVRLRYRHQAAPATVLKNLDGTLTVAFESPQNAPTPGQGAAFYVEDEVLGAGIITS